MSASKTNIAKEQYFAVLDQYDMLWGAGKTKSKARQDAYRWHNENGPAELPFKPATPCSREVCEDWPDAIEEIEIIDGVIYAKKEIENRNKMDLLKKSKHCSITLSEFQSVNDIRTKLDILFNMLMNR